MVTLENVILRYLSAAEPAISDVSLCVETGELSLLARPSGCGKSTLIGRPCARADALPRSAGQAGDAEGFPTYIAEGLLDHLVGR